MTERALRERHIESNIYGEICSLCGGQSTEGPEQIEHLPECPMADDPDVVGLLRKVVALHKEALDKGPTAYSVVRCETLWEIKTELEKVVRLTDDGGYEWTD